MIPVVLMLPLKLKQDGPNKMAVYRAIKASDKTQQVSSPAWPRKKPPNIHTVRPDPTFAKITFLSVALKRIKARGKEKTN